MMKWLPFFCSDVGHGETFQTRPSDFHAPSSVAQIGYYMWRDGLAIPENNCMYILQFSLSNASSGLTEETILVGVLQ